MIPILPALILMQPQVRVVELLHYGFQVPEGFRLQQQEPSMTDFEVWDITRSTGGDPVGLIYLGNHANCPDLMRLGGVVKRTAAGEWTLRTESKGGSEHMEALLNAEGVRYKAQDFSIWSQVHVRLDGLTPQELAHWRKAVLALKIIHPVIE